MTKDSSCCTNVNVIKTLTKVLVLQVKVAQQSPADSGSIVQEPHMRPLSVSNLPERRLAGSPREGLRSKRGQLTPSPEASTKPNENCRVQ